MRPFVKSYGEIVDVHPVARKNFDVTPAQTAGYVGDDAAPVIQLNGKRRTRFPHDFDVKGDDGRASATK
jgi:hypothetical protein